MSQPMKDQKLPNDAIAVSEKASVDIRAVRESLQDLCERLALSNNTAKEIARNALCRSLVERLALAESETRELAEMIALADTPP